MLPPKLGFAGDNRNACAEGSRRTPGREITVDSGKAPPRCRSFLKAFLSDS
jgi:hypothetical protein